MNRTQVENRRCKHCSRKMRGWPNHLGTITYVCDSCDSP